MARLKYFKQEAILSGFSKRAIRFLFAAGLSLMVLNLSVKPVDAASNSLAVFPPILKIRLKPAGVVRQPIRVFNYSDSDIYVTYEIKVFENGSLTGQPIWNEEIKPPNWVKLIGPIDNDRKTYEISRQGFTDFTLIIQPSAKTINKDWYFSILLKPQTVKTSQNSHTSILPQIGMNVLLSVNNNLQVGNRPVVIEKFWTPRLISGLEKNIKVDLRLFNPNQVWVEALPVIKIEKIIGLGSNEVFNLVPISLLSKNNKVVFLTEKDIELADINDRALAHQPVKSSPIVRIKHLFFSKEDIKTAKMVRLYTDSFRFGVFSFNASVTTAGQVNQTQRLIIFLPWQLIFVGLIATGLLIYRKFIRKKPA